MYETSSNLMITNNKKDPNLITNSFINTINTINNINNINNSNNSNKDSKDNYKSHQTQNLKENENNKKIILKSKLNNSSTLNENNNNNINNKIFLHNKNPLIKTNVKSSVDKRESLTSQNIESNSALLNNSDLHSSKSSWKFDKNLLDDSSFRKQNIKKEKLEIDCDKESSAGHKKTLSTQTLDLNNLNSKDLSDLPIKDKFIAFSSANANNSSTNNVCNKSNFYGDKESKNKANDDFQLNDSYSKNNKKETWNNKGEKNNETYSVINNRSYSEQASIYTVEDVNGKKLYKEKLIENQLQQQKMENLKKNLVNTSNYNSTNKIIENLDKNGFINKNIVNMKNIQLNKSILQNNNAIIHKNIQSNPNLNDKNNNNDNRNIYNPYTQKNFDDKISNDKINDLSNKNNNNNNRINSAKKTDKKLNKSLSSFKFEFDEEDPLNASTYSNFKKPENEEFFNKIVNHHILIEFHQVHDFLEGIGLEKHLDNFLKNGFDDLEKMINGKIQFLLFIKFFKFIKFIKKIFTFFL